MISGQYSRDLRFDKDSLRRAAERVAEKLGVTLQARTKAELASFLAFYDPTEKLQTPRATGGSE